VPVNAFSVCPRELNACAVGTLDGTLDSWPPRALECNAVSCGIERALGIRGSKLGSGILGVSSQLLTTLNTCAGATAAGSAMAIGGTGGRTTGEPARLRPLLRGLALAMDGGDGGAARAVTGFGN
jgi:hypothetical protein